MGHGHGVWGTEHGATLVVQGSWLRLHGAWPWCMVHASWCIDQWLGIMRRAMAHSSLRMAMVRGLNNRTAGHVQAYIDCEMGCAAGQA
mmetsp:Transcript_15602/g.45997  ORF Transcript_15602/g.45997 Transcript_15602/m.45997 type:complete len:88 (+) Transcript_15602:212-475(+)